MAAGGKGRALLPDRGTFDLFLTRTDLHGWPRHLPLSRDLHPADLFERTHAHVMAFRNRPAQAGATGSELGDDFDLTYATRTTAGFPVAFAPVGVAEIERDFREARPDAAPASEPRFTRAHLREHELAEPPMKPAWMVDGGVLDNKPFSHVAQAIEDKPADHEVFRIVAYVEPDPELGIEAAPGSPPPLFRTLQGLYALFRHEPIHGDLRALQERNEKVERIRAVRDANLPNAVRAAQEVGARHALAWPPQAGDLERWRAVTNAAAARDHLSGYPGYVVLKARCAAFVLAQAVCRALEYPECSRHAYLVRRLVRGWLAAQGALAEPAFNQDDGGYRLAAAQMLLLKAFDVPFRVRRIRSLVQAVNAEYRLLANRAEAEKHAAREALDACKRALADIAFAYEAVRRDSAGIGEEIRSALGTLPSDEIDRLIGGLKSKDEAGQVVDRFAAQIERVYDALVARFAATGEEQNRQIAAALAQLPQESRDRVGIAFAAFPFLDLTLFPLMDAAGVTDLILVETMRISPHDAVFLSPDPQRLMSREMGAFAGFLKRHAREHDLMWGRLDGAERLIELIVKAAVEDAGRREPLHPALAELRRNFTRRAMQAVIEEEIARPATSMAPLAGALRERLAATS